MGDFYTHFSLMSRTSRKKISTQAWEARKQQEEHTGQGGTSLRQSPAEGPQYQYEWLCVSSEVSITCLSCSWAGSLLVLVFPGILVALSPCPPLHITRAPKYARAVTKQLPRSRWGETALECKTYARGPEAIEQALKGFLASWSLFLYLWNHKVEPDQWFFN